jgi:hypothetical protein
MISVFFDSQHCILSWLSAQDEVSDREGLLRSAYEILTKGEIKYLFLFRTQKTMTSAAGRGKVEKPRRGGRWAANWLGSGGGEGLKSGEGSWCERVPQTSHKQTVGGRLRLEVFRGGTGFLYELHRLRGGIACCMSVGTLLGTCVAK